MMLLKRRMMFLKRRMMFLKGMMMLLFRENDGFEVLGDVIEWRVT